MEHEHFWAKRSSELEGSISKHYIPLMLKSGRVSPIHSTNVGCIISIDVCELCMNNFLNIIENCGNDIIKNYGKCARTNILVALATPNS